MAQSPATNGRFGGSSPFGSPLVRCRGGAQTHYRAPYLLRVFFSGGKAPLIGTFRFSLADMHSLENLPIQWHGWRSAAAIAPAPSPAMLSMELLEWLGVSPEHAGFDPWLRAHVAVEHPHRAARASSASTPIARGIWAPRVPGRAAVRPAVPFHARTDRALHAARPGHAWTAQDTADLVWRVEGRRLHVVCSLIDW